MRIDRRLFLVQEIPTETGKVFVHSAPLSRDVWENYFLVLSKTFAAIMSEGLTVVSGPAIAKMLLKRVAVLSGVWEGDEGVERGLLAEIRRLTNVVIPTGNGWETLPYEQVLARQLIDEDDIEAAEGALVFFICVSAVLRGRVNNERKMMLLNGLGHMWDAQSSSLDVTALAASLQTSMPAESSGEMHQQSLVPH